MKTFPQKLPDIYHRRAGFENRRISRQDAETQSFNVRIFLKFFVFFFLRSPMLNVKRKIDLFRLTIGAHTVWLGSRLPFPHLVIP